jgi:hypothetical protein
MRMVSAFAKLMEIDNPAMHTPASRMLFNIRSSSWFPPAIIDRAKNVHTYGIYFQ